MSSKGGQKISVGPQAILLCTGWIIGCLLCVNVFRFTGYPGQDIKVNTVSFQHIWVKQFFSLSDMEQLDLSYHLK